MIQFLAGEKGVGKTKHLIDMANAAAKTTDGDLVFIENGRRHIYDLHYNIRFVETATYPLSNYREFVGFLCGVLSQNNDIEEIYVGGLNKVIKSLDNEGLVKLISKLEKLSADHEVNFTMTINANQDDLPEEVRPLLFSM
jgi:hypothetical protein